MSYTKLFQEIVTSSIWGEADHTRIVWVTMLAIADKNGEIQASVPGLARIANVPRESAEKAIEVLLSPDPYSRTADDEGRRIASIEGGWCLLNYQKYREKATDCDRREQARLRQARFRERQRRNAPCVTESDVTEMSRQSNARIHKQKQKQKQKQNSHSPSSSVRLGSHSGESSEIPPCSLEQAKSFANENAIEPDAAEKWWLVHDARGWLDDRGNPVIRWHSSLIAYGQSWRRNETAKQTDNHGRKKPTGDQSDASRYAGRAGY